MDQQGFKAWQIRYGRLQERVHPLLISIKPKATLNGHTLLFNHLGRSLGAVTACWRLHADWAVRVLPGFDICSQG